MVANRFSYRKGPQGAHVFLGQVLPGSLHFREDRSGAGLSGIAIRDQRGISCAHYRACKDRKSGWGRGSQYHGDYETIKRTIGSYLHFL